MIPRHSFVFSPAGSVTATAPTACRCSARPSASGWTGRLISSIEREAEDDDFTDHPGPYELYQKTCEARKADRRLSAGAVARLPAARVPDVRGARHPHRRATGATGLAASAAAETVKTVPPDVIEIADRAVKMVELHGKAGQYEEIVTDLQGQLAAMKEQFSEALGTISAQKTLIETLKMKSGGLMARLSTILQVVSDVSMELGTTQIPVVQAHRQSRIRTSRR